MSIKNIIYSMLMNSSMFQEYQYKLGKKGSKVKFSDKIFEIIKLNYKYRIKKNGDVKYFDKLLFPESSENPWKDKKKLWGELEKNDVISFDIFDTLIFRVVEDPIDVFTILENEWKINGFAIARQKAERKLREKTREITLYSIYELLHEKLGIEIKEGIDKELEVEKKVCFANPYMFSIYCELKKRGKRLIAISDMYISEKQMRDLLQSCNYQLDNIYISCDFGVGKTEGKLQNIVKQDFPSDTKFIHIGDNKIADILGSKEAGWNTWYYPNIAMEGKPYRLYWIKSISSKFYNEIINCKLHSGFKRYNLYYEYGFVFGGIFAIGFCQFLNRLCKSKKLDRLIFLTREENILYKIYKDMYPEEVSSQILLTARGAEQLSIKDGWKNISSNDVEDGLEFFHGIMKKKEKICLVDGTWQGRMAIELKYFLEDNFHGDFEVYCAIFGITDDEKKLVNKEKIYNYMILRKNKFLGKWHFANAKKLMSLMFHVQHNKNLRKMSESIRNGMLDFEREYMGLQEKFGNIMDISEEEAYILFDYATKAQKYMIKLLSNI